MATVLPTYTQAGAAPWALSSTEASCTGWVPHGSYLEDSTETVH